MEKEKNNYLKLLRSMVKKSNDTLSDSLQKIDKTRQEMVVSNRDKIKKNPVLEIIEKAKPMRDDTTTKQWKNIATMNALGNTLSLIGQGITASKGGRIARLDSTPTYMAVKYIDKLNDNYRADSDRYFKARMNEAIRGENVAQQTAKWYLDSLEKQQKQNHQTSERRAKELIDYYKRKDTHQNNLEKIVKSNTLKKDSSIKNTSSSSKSSAAIRKPITYVKDTKKKSVPIHQEDWTELYRVADAYGILDEYKKSSNADQRKHNLNVAIQKAYILRERDLKGKADFSSIVTQSPRYTPHPSQDRLTVK